MGLICITYLNNISAPNLSETERPADGFTPKSLLRKSGYILKDFSFTKFDKDEKVFILSGSRLETKGSKFGIFRFNPKKIAEIQNIQILFFNNNKPASKAIAPFGIFDPVSGKISLLKGARFETIDRKKQLTSDSLSFNCKDRLIISKKACILNISGKITETGSIRCDMDFENFADIK